LADASDRPFFGYVGRLAEQQGLELVLPVLEELLALPAQRVLLGTGAARYEQLPGERAAANPDNMAVVLAYNETLAHRIEAAADIFLMSSLFEPCGLNQLYSLRFGTPPLVREMGGLADTVIDADEANRAAGSATGFVFSEPASAQLLAGARRAATLWRVPAPGRHCSAAPWRRFFLAGQRCTVFGALPLQLLTTR
jgi:starch synthase